jgi:hypothetical protein
VLKVKAEGRKHGRSVLNEDMKQTGLKRCDAQDRTIWRNGVLGNV